MILVIVDDGAVDTETGSAWNSAISASSYDYTTFNRVAAKKVNLNHVIARSVASHSTGKRCFMVTLTSEVQNDGLIIGLVPSTTGTGSGNFPGVDANSWGCQFNRNAGPVKVTNNVYTAFTASTRCDVGDVAMVAVDLDAGQIWFGRNGTWYTQGSAPNPATGANPAFTFTPGPTLFAALSDYYAPASRRLWTDPAAMPYSPPSGFSGW